VAGVVSGRNGKLRKKRSGRKVLQRGAAEDAEREKCEESIGVSTLTIIWARTRKNIGCSVGDGFGPGITVDQASTPLSPT